MRERRRDYELMVIISPLSSADQDLSASVERVQQSIIDAGGTVTSVETGPPWGRRKLAYPIREFVEGEPYRRVFNEGFYVLYLFTMPAAQIIELERVLKLNESVLRHLLTQVDPRMKVAPRPVAAVNTIDDEEPEDLDEEVDDEE